MERSTGSGGEGNLERNGELKILRGQPRAGSSPALGTIFSPDSVRLLPAKDFGNQSPARRSRVTLAVLGLPQRGGCLGD
jgi:hypothetical protein